MDKFNNIDNNIIDKPILPNINEIIKSGEKILNENDFFYELNFLMSDDNFRPFYEKYFKDSTDIKTALLYMKLYETIQKEYKERNNSDISKELLIYMIKELMNNNNSRKIILNSFDKFFNKDYNEKKYILDIFDYNK